MIDAPVVLRSFLIAQTTLTALTSTRVWAERNNPVPDYRPEQGGAIAFRSRGGQGLDYSGQILRGSWVFKCYGEDEAQAGQVYRALVDVLQDATTGGLYVANLDVTGQILSDISGWPYSLSYWSTLMNRSFVPTE